MIKAISFGLAGAVLVTAGVLAFNQNDKSVAADTATSQVTKVAKTQQAKPKTLTLAVEHVQHWYKTVNPTTDPTSIWWDVKNNPDSMRVLAVKGEGDDPNGPEIDKYSWQSEPAGKGVPSFVEDGASNETDVPNLDTNPDATTLGDIRAELKKVIDDPALIAALDAK